MLSKMGNFIKAKREELGYTREEFGAKIGVAYYVVQNWEDGKIMPEPDRLLAIATVFGIGVEELLCGGKEETVQEDSKEEIKIDSTTIEQVESESPRPVPIVQSEEENVSKQKTVRKKKEKSYYEEFHEKYGYEKGTLPPESYTRYEPKPRGKGFFKIESLLGYFLCAIFSIIFMVSSIISFNRSFNSPIQLDNSNYERYLEVSIKRESLNKSTYVITVKNKDNYAVRDLQMDVEVNLKVLSSKLEYTDIVIETKTIRISCAELASGKTIEKNVEFADKSVFKYETIEVLSVKGRT